MRLRSYHVAATLAAAPTTPSRPRVADVSQTMVFTCGLLSLYTSRDDLLQRWRSAFILSLRTRTLPHSMDYFSSKLLVASLMWRSGEKDSFETGFCIFGGITNCCRMDNFSWASPLGRGNCESFELSNRARRNIAQAEQLEASTNDS